MEKRRNLVLFTGNSPTKLRAELSKWVEIFETKFGEGNSVRIEAGTFQPEMVVTELLSPPFFVEKRLVIFEGVPKGKAKKDAPGAAEGPTADAKTFDPAAKIEAAVLSVFDTIPDSTVAVFVSEEPDAKSELGKRLLSEGDVRRFDSFDAAGAEAYVRENLPGLDVAGRRELSARTAGNDALLTDAVERLSLAFGDKSIGLKQVEEAVPKILESDVFALADAVAAMDPVRTAKLLRAAMATDSPRKTFPVVMGELRKTLYIATLRDAGASKSEIQEALEMKSAWGIDKRQRLSQEAHDRLFTLYERLVEFDADSKTGNAPGEDDDEIFENGILRALMN
jgi:DNA polymerase III delta subunit